MSWCHFDIISHDVICLDVIFHDVICHDIIFHDVIYHNIICHDIVSGGKKGLTIDTRNKYAHKCRSEELLPAKIKASMHIKRDISLPSPCTRHRPAHLWASPRTGWSGQRSSFCPTPWTQWRTYHCQILPGAWHHIFHDVGFSIHTTWVVLLRVRVLDCVNTGTGIKTPMMLKKRTNRRTDERTKRLKTHKWIVNKQEPA